MILPLGSSPSARPGDRRQASHTFPASRQGPGRWLCREGGGRTRTPGPADPETQLAAEIDRLGGGGGLLPGDKEILKAQGIMGVFTPGSGALAAAREILQQLLACDEAQSEGRRHQPASSDTASAPPAA